MAASSLASPPHPWPGSREDGLTSFNLMVARRGRVILDESFGNWSWGEMTRETPTEMASLTKLVTGLLFAQFVDQGLIGIDERQANTVRISRSPATTFSRRRRRLRCSCRSR